MQDNELTGDLSAYAADLSGLELPSATRFFSVGGNQLTGVISEEFQKLGAFLPGAWNILDGLLFQKTLNLSQNAFSGELPTWALHSMSADEGLTVQLAVRPLFGAVIHAWRAYTLQQGRARLKFTGPVPFGSTVKTSYSGFQAPVPDPSGECMHRETSGLAHT